LQLIEKNRIVKVLASIVIVMLVLMQTITIQDHPIIYNFLTWLTWPALFFIAGYYANYKMDKSNILHIVKRYLVPYIITGFLIIVINKIVQVLQLSSWINTPFPSMKIGVVTMLYGNGWPTDTLIGHRDFGVGLLWVLLALFFSICIQLVVNKIPVQFIKIITSLILMVLGFYLGTKVQLPWSLNAALIMQPYVLLGKSFKTVSTLNINAPVTICVGLLSVWLVSVGSGPFELTLATTRYWFFGVITAILGLNMLIFTARYINKMLINRFYYWFVKLGEKQLVNIAVLSFVVSIIPVGRYVSSLIKIPHGVLIFIWLMVFIIVLSVKVVIQYIGQHYFNWSEDEEIG